MPETSPTPDDLAFLSVIADPGDGGVNDLPPAGREQTRVRQRCKRMGLAAWGGGRWHLTDRGRAALDAAFPKNEYPLGYMQGRGAA
jgi:hypothetical protein